MHGLRKVKLKIKWPGRLEKTQIQQKTLKKLIIGFTPILNNSRFGDYFHLIHPNELVVNNNTHTQKYVSYLGIVKGRRLKTKPYYKKRDDFTFSITETPTSNEWIADH